MFNIEISHDFGVVEEFIDSIKSQLQNPDLKKSARSVVKEFQSVIRGGKFTPLSRATREIRLKRGRSGTRPLTETRKLAGSIESRLGKAEFSVGSKLRHARLLRFGGLTDSSSAIPGKRVPKRDFMPVSQKLLNTVARNVLDGLK